MEIWFEDEGFVLQVGGEGIVPLPRRHYQDRRLRHLHHRGRVHLLHFQHFHLPRTRLFLTDARTDDELSHHEGDGSSGGPIRTVWINEGNKIEPAQASQFITRTLQSHFPGPIYKFLEFPIDVQDSMFEMFMKNHRFLHTTDEVRARHVWTTTARANFKNLLYNIRRNAGRNCVSVDKNVWKDYGPVWMRREHWVTLCNVWAREDWAGKFAQAKRNRASHPEANVHTSGSISFATHKARLEAQLQRTPQFQEVFDETHKKKGTDDSVNDRAREVAESYSRRMNEKYMDETERLELDPDVWIAASGGPKKGHVYGFGHSLGTARVISSCSSSISHATSPFTTPAAPGGSFRDDPTWTPDHFQDIINRTVSQTLAQSIPQIVSQIVSQTLAQMGIIRDTAPRTEQPQVSGGFSLCRWSSRSLSVRRQSSPPPTSSSSGTSWLTSWASGKTEHLAFVYASDLVNLTV